MVDVCLNGVLHFASRPLKRPARVCAAGTTLYVFIPLPLTWVFENYAEPQPLPWVVRATCLGRGCRSELTAMPWRMPRRPCAAASAADRNQEGQRSKTAQLAPAEDQLVQGGAPSRG
eukprot:s2368_g3.t1